MLIGGDCGVAVGAVGHAARRHPRSRRGVAGRAPRSAHARLLPVRGVQRHGAAGDPRRRRRRPRARRRSVAAERLVLAGAREYEPAEDGAVAELGAAHARCRAPSAEPDALADAVDRDRSDRGLHPRRPRCARPRRDERGDGIRALRGLARRSARGRSRACAPPSRWSGRASPDSRRPLPPQRSTTSAPSCGSSGRSRESDPDSPDRLARGGGPRCRARRAHRPVPALPGLAAEPRRLRVRHRRRLDLGIDLEHRARRAARGTVDLPRDAALGVPPRRHLRGRLLPDRRGRRSPTGSSRTRPCTRASGGDTAS